MWSSETFDDDGGFNTTMTQSPAAGTGKEAKKNTVVPVAIREVLTNDEENKNTHVVVVGLIKQVETQTLKNMFTIEDNTGRLLCIQWGDEDELSKCPSLIENVYFKVVGTKRVQNNKITLLCHNVRPLETLNELTHHLLSIIALPYQLEEVNLANTTAPNSTNRNDFSSNNDNIGGFSDTGIGGYSSSIAAGMTLNPKQLKVYSVIKQCPDELGYSAADVQKILPEKMPLMEIEKIFSFFVEEGHIFSTIDENHYKVTDFTPGL